jgi:hypothetical protein
MFKKLIAAVKQLIRLIKNFFLQRSEAGSVHELPTEITIEGKDLLISEIIDITIQEPTKELKKRARKETKDTSKAKKRKAPVPKEKPKAKLPKKKITPLKDKESTKDSKLSPHDYLAEHVIDIPDKIENKTIYVVGENGYDWLATFRCPCGCNSLIQLSLLKETDPSWSITHHGKKVISISPSVNRVIGCKSHFFITKGDVQWR